MTNISAHYANDRLLREKVIRELGKGYIVKEVTWDRGHVNGAEVHKILSNGVIEIYNERTGKLVTKIVARPNQIKRYWANNTAPWWLVDRVTKNAKNGMCV